jgi:hypothetical protein
MPTVSFDWNLRSGMQINIHIVEGEVLLFGTGIAPQGGQWQCLTDAAQVRQVALMRLRRRSRKARGLHGYCGMVAGDNDTVLHVVAHRDTALSSGGGICPCATLPEPWRRVLVPEDGDGVLPDPVSRGTSC